MFLFAAGRHTTTELLSKSLKVLGDRTDVQDALRRYNNRMPIFVAEALPVNHDPVRFTSARLSVDCKNVREQIAFGRVAHSRPGGPLARGEGAGWPT
jgi:hypothetical protein